PPEPEDEELPPAPDRLCWALPAAAPAAPATAPVAPAAAAPIPAALPPATEMATAGATTRINAGSTRPAAANSSIDDAASVPDRASDPELSQHAARYSKGATGLNSSAATTSPSIDRTACLPVLSENEAAA